MNLLVITNLFPDESEPWRGLDNATLVHALREKEPALQVRVLAFRPSLRHLGGTAAPLHARAEDACLHPSFFWTSYLPKLGGCNHWLFAHALARACKDLPADFHPHAILAPWLFPDACAAALHALKWRIPVVAVAQGSDVHHYLASGCRRRAIRAMSRRVQAIVTRSQDLARRLVDNDIAADKVHTIYNGVDVRTFTPAPREEARLKLNLHLPQQARLLLFVGNFLPVKGLDLLLQAFARLPSTAERPVQLALIGSGPLEPALRSQARELQVYERVLFPGRHGPAQIALWMQAADAVCLTSHNEGVPNVVLESLSSGRAPVCMDVGGIAEVVKPVLGTRFLVPSRDAALYAAALQDALDHPPDETALHDYARAFSWENCAADYLRLLRPH
ncbi:glycosyltransferase [Prosthecobacter sp.]|uniref:glycosyltransferase n=1 Tax=Prosthecobacter sp. TaxID=1965333 RepID=UPI003783FED8